MGNDINDTKPAYSVHDTIVEILKNSGCEVDSSSSGDIMFAYEGEWIVISVHEEIQSISAIDWHWHGVSKFDIEALSHMYSKVNEVNSGWKGKMVWEEGDDDMVYVSTLYDIPFAEEFTDKENLLHGICKVLLSYRAALLPAEQKDENPQ